jgi:hypothetical protein
MKKNNTRAPSLKIQGKQLASLRTKQEWHERLAREHAASAKRLWLRRVLLELDQEREKKKRKRRVGVGTKVGHRAHAAK